MRGAAGSQSDPRAQPGRVWCIGDWAKIDPRTGQVHGSDESVDVLCLRNDVWDAESGVASLRGARNEFLSFQIVIESLGAPIRDISVSAQDFEGPDRLVADRHVQFFRELQVSVEGGWYPDGLLPFDLGCALPFSVPDSENGIPNQRVAVVWVDVYVPKAIPVGAYEAAFKVSYRGMYKLSEFFVHLQVVDLTLPDHLSLHVDLMDTGNSSAVCGFPGVIVDSPRYRAIEREFYRMAHAHRATFSMVPCGQDGAVPKGLAPPLRGVGDRISVAGWAEWDERFGPLLDGSAFEDLPRGGLPISHFILPVGLEYPSSSRYFGTDRFEVENRTIVTEFIYHIAQKGWIDPLYLVYYNAKKQYGFYPWDLQEPASEEDVEALRTLSSVIRSSLHGHPGLRALLRLDVEHFHCTEHRECVPNIEAHLRGHFDLWNISDSHWNDRSAATIKGFVDNDGIEAWFYTQASRVQDSFQAMHDYPWLAWRRGAHGISFKMHGEPDTASDEDQSTLALMYPGAKYGLDGPIGSMRLKVLRRGLQEFELLQIAVERKGQKAVQDLVSATFPCRPQDWHSQRKRLMALLIE
ncbi:MAG: hypothetical protein ABIH23_31270 [bacterium]